MSLPPPGSTCNCPITKTVTVNFTGSTPAPSNGYIVGYRKAGSTGSYTYVSPNPTSSPASIPNVPVCEDIEVIMQSQCDNSQVSAPQTSTVTAYTSYVCGNVINQNHTHTGFYVYPDLLLDVRGASDTVSLALDVNTLPNRFTVYDANGNVVTSSTSVSGNVGGWLGVAAYSGPWGAQSLSAPTTGTLSFSKNGGCFFRLVVESQTGTNTNDSFTVNISCPTTGTVANPTITFLSCANGTGQYRINAAANTSMKISLTGTASILKTSLTSCAHLTGTITSSTGPSNSETSAIVSSAVTPEIKTIGPSNSLFVFVTTPGVGYFTISTLLQAINSAATNGSGSITIFEYNGFVLETPITQSICIGTDTGVVSCGGGGGGATAYDCVNGECIGTVGGAYPDYASCVAACSGSGGGNQE